MTRLIIIGIDGMDPDVFERLKSKLPNLDRLIFNRADSTFPPDSIPAWATIYTGIHPSQHGWLDNVDYEDIKKGESALNVGVLEGNTFWDKASEHNCRVCIINPLLAYPVWHVNGVMVNGPVFITGEIQAYPQEILNQYSLPSLGGMTDFPDETHLPDFIRKTFKETEQLGDFGHELYARENWDLFFISFFSLDRLQHFLWRYYDKEDPTYPGLTDYADAIPKLYMLFDRIIGKFISLAGKDVQIMIISDHGHGRRPLLQININELLRMNGLLVTYDSKNSFSTKKVIEKTKNSVLGFLSRQGLENVGYMVGRILPKKYRQTLKKSSFIIDKGASLAWTSEIGSGTSTGGIEINHTKVPSDSIEYEGLVKQIILIIKEYADSTNQPLVEWISTRDKLYPVQVSKQYLPDIVFELNKEYSVGRSVFIDLISRSPRHTRISGGHRKEGVFFWFGHPFNVQPGFSIMEYHDFILDKLGIETQKKMDRHENLTG